MSQIRTLVLAGGIALAWLLAATAAQAQLCSNPPPYDQTQTPRISPRPTFAGNEVTFWMVGARAVLDSSSVVRNGNQIAITMYVSGPEYTLPLEPLNCWPVSLGILPVGSYEITEITYFRPTDGNPPLPPSTFGPHRPFVVIAAPQQAVPTPAVSVYSLLFVAIVLAVVGALASRRFATTER